MREYTIDAGTSSVVVQARSSVGPIAWEITSPTGNFFVEVEGQSVRLDSSPTGEVRIQLANLRSGNAVYDAELLRRVNARQYPEARVELSAVEPVNERSVHARGVMHMHGAVQDLVGLLDVEVREDESIVVTGQHMIDIRDFGIPTPQMLMLKIFPDVRVFLFIRGTPREGQADGS